MKRLLLLMITLILSISLIACGADNKQVSSDKKDDAIPSEIIKTDENKIKDDEQSDPGDTHNPQWQGEWIGDWFSIEITEVDDQSFWFEIISLEKGTTVLGGNADLYPDDDSMASHDGISFALYEDDKMIEISEPISSGWGSLRGQYSLLDPANPYNHDEDFQESDPGDTYTFEWAGLWVGDEYSIEITQDEYSDFWFEIINLKSGSIEMAGNANLYPDDAHMAEYEGISFYLYEDFSSIDFFATESSQWAHLRGQYDRW